MEGQEGRAETTVKFTWTINNFSKLIRDKLCSDTFLTGRHQWRIQLQQFEAKFGSILWISLFVEDIGSSSRSGSFKLSLINQIDSKMTRTEEFQDVNCFINAGTTGTTGCFGLPLPITSAKFYDPFNGFLVNDKCIIVVEIFDNSSKKNILLLLDKSSSSYSVELFSDVKGVGKVKNDFVGLLEEACSKHPSLVESNKKIKMSQSFNEWSFYALGRVLHFLKNKKVKDMMNVNECVELRNLWEDLKMARFDDLSWLEPHVQSALGIKSYMERAGKVKRLKDNLADLEARMVATKANLHFATLELVIAEKGILKRDLEDHIGY